jgi:hypothetical protein
LYGLNIFLISNKLPGLEQLCHYGSMFLLGNWYWAFFVRSTVTTNVSNGPCFKYSFPESFKFFWAMLHLSTLVGAWHLWAGLSICPPGSANAGTPISSLAPLFFVICKWSVIFPLEHAGQLVIWCSGLNLVLPEMVITGLKSEPKIWREITGLHLRVLCFLREFVFLRQWNYRYWLFRQLKLRFWCEISTDGLLS